jgi:hypothetical protein
VAPVPMWHGLAVPCLLPFPEQPAYICPAFWRLSCVSHQPSSSSCLPCELLQPRAQCRRGRRDRPAIGEQRGPRPRTGRRRCTAGSSPARDDRPRPARRCGRARAHLGTRAGAGTSQPPIPPTGLGSGATCRSRAPQQTARACCMPPTATHRPGSVLPADGQLLYRLAATPKRLQPVSARTAAAIDGAPWAARAAGIDLPAGQAAAGRAAAGQQPADQRPASAYCW